MAEPLRVGVIGLGAVSAAYLATLRRVGTVRVTSVADRDPGRAAAALDLVPTARLSSVDELLAADDVDLVLNLTTPEAHADIASASLAAGKHVYGEKPLAASVAEATAVLASANEQRIGCAPDTVLGTGTQTARKIVDDGLIGVPIAANAVFVSPGHEAWHPEPEFYYRVGGGPLFDMGPYYLTALIHLLGPVDRVVGAASRSRARRSVGAGARAGTEFDVEVESHVAGVLVHESGAVTTLITSFDVVASTQPHIEIHGSEGSLSVPDPNQFHGDVRVRRIDDRRWSVVPPSAGYIGAARGVGVADLAASAASGVPHRASAEVALHVLDVMETLIEAARDRVGLDVRSTCERPPPVPLMAF
jgi:predicted dehydrogenase